MEKIISFIILLFVIISSLFSQIETELFYGQTPPADSAELFRIGDYFDNEDNRKRSFNLAFSPDGKEMFFSYVKSRSEIEGTLYQIKTFKYENDEWKGPEIASFSSKMGDVDINFSPNGKYVFYASNRSQPNSVGNDIYYSVNLNNGWSESIYAGTDVNTSFNEVYPSISDKGNLFFQSTRPGGHGSIDLYRAEWINGNFINVKNLGSQINTEYYESDAVISPNERYILFCSQRNDEENRQIYISFQIRDNIWTEAKKLGLNINNGFAGSPTFSADGKYLFFRKRNGIHWISTKFIEELKPNGQERINTQKKVK